MVEIILYFFFNIVLTLTFLICEYKRENINTVISYSLLYLFLGVPVLIVCVIFGIIAGIYDDIQKLRNA